MGFETLGNFPWYPNILACVYFKATAQISAVQDRPTFTSFSGAGSGLDSSSAVGMTAVTMHTHDLGSAIPLSRRTFPCLRVRSLVPKAPPIDIRNAFLDESGYDDAVDSSVHLSKHTYVGCFRAQTDAGHQQLCLTSSLMMPHPFPMTRMIALSSAWSVPAALIEIAQMSLWWFKGRGRHS
eukprot:6071959-Amphidinium_carterae.1